MSNDPPSGTQSPADAAEAMKARLRRDLVEAMRARARPEVAVLRALVAAIDDAQALPAAEGHVPYAVHAFGDGSAEAPRLRLNETQVIDLLKREVAARLEAATEMDTLARPDRAATLRAEATVVSRYLA